MDDKAFLFILAAVLLIALILFLKLWFSKNAVIKRRLKRAPFRHFTEIRNGEVARFVGKIELVDDPLKAPLSGRRCAYFHVRVEQRVSTGKSAHWKTIIQEEASSRFVLREGNRLACIYSPGIKSYVVDDLEYKSGFRNDASNELERYLNDHQQKSVGFFGANKTIRYREGILEENEKVAVSGAGEWRNASDIGLPARFERVLVIGSPKDGNVYLSNDPDITKQPDSQF